MLEVGEADRHALIAGLEYLLNISFVNDDEVLKICLDFWHFFVLDVFDSLSPTPASSPGTPRAPVAMQASFNPCSPIHCLQLCAPKHVVCVAHVA